MNLKQLAKELNLSISAVSKALRDSHEISASTKAAVIAKAKELNYQVNPFASSLRKQKSKTIAVLVPEVANNFFSLAINGIESIAQERGYHVLIYLTHEDMQKEISITKLLQNGRVDGIMMSLSSQTSNIIHLEELKEKQIPLVLFDRVADNIDCPKINTDDYKSSYRATEHLIENGCKNIAFLSISNHLSISNKRMNGYADAIKTNGLSFENNLIVECSNDEAENKSILKKLLKSKKRPEAIFASVEKLALNTYEVCKDLKINIPNDVKVIGFSNLQTASLLHPSLTTITQPAYEMGREAASILFKIIEKRGYNLIMEKTTLKSEIIFRESTRDMKK
jgi:LacI family transcriptional regulator